MLNPCSTCRFFMRLPNVPSTARLGECRAALPVMRDGYDATGFWPVVKNDDGCAHHEGEPELASEAPGPASPPATQTTIHTPHIKNRGR